MLSSVISYICFTYSWKVYSNTFACFRTVVDLIEYFFAVSFLILIIFAFEVKLLAVEV